MSEPITFVFIDSKWERLLAAFGLRGQSIFMLEGRIASILFSTQKFERGSTFAQRVAPVKKRYDQYRLIVETGALFKMGVEVLKRKTTEDEEREFLQHIQNLGIPSDVSKKLRDHSDRYSDLCKRSNFLESITVLFKNEVESLIDSLQTLEKILRSWSVCDFFHCPIKIPTDSVLVHSKDEVLGDVIQTLKYLSQKILTANEKRELALQLRNCATQLNSAAEHFHGQK